MLSFETTESVIEVLWDIALALFVLRSAFTYFLLTLVLSILSQHLGIDNLLPGTLNSAIHTRILTTLILSSFSASITIIYQGIPRIAALRLSIGGIALWFMATTQLLIAFIHFEEGRTSWFPGMSLRTVLSYCLYAVVYAITPALLMEVEGLLSQPRTDARQSYRSKRGYNIMSVLRSGDDAKAKTS